MLSLAAGLVNLALFKGSALRQSSLTYKLRLGARGSFTSLAGSSTLPVLPKPRQQAVPKEFRSLYRHRALRQFSRLLGGAATLFQTPQPSPIAHSALGRLELVSRLAAWSDSMTA